jgi:hypothetical protein
MSSQQQLGLADPAPAACRLCSAPTDSRDSLGRPCHRCCAFAEESGDDYCVPCGRRLGPIVRSADPVSAHVAAELIEPKRGTRRREVLDRLRAAVESDGWVHGTELATQACGGSEGLRRLRELEEQGWPIERRPVSGSTVWQYRLGTEMTW